MSHQFAVLPLGGNLQLPQGKQAGIRCWNGKPSRPDPSPRLSPDHRAPLGGPQPSKNVLLQARDYN